MHVETFRRETVKKFIGLTELPEAPAENEEPVPVYIAKGLGMTDFMGMMFVIPPDEENQALGSVEFINRVVETYNHSYIEIFDVYGHTYRYYPETGALVNLTV